MVFISSLFAFSFSKSGGDDCPQTGRLAQPAQEVSGPIDEYSNASDLGLGLWIQLPMWLPLRLAQRPRQLQSKEGRGRENEDSRVCIESEPTRCILVSVSWVPRLRPFSMLCRRALLRRPSLSVPAQPSAPQHVPEQRAQPGLSPPRSGSQWTGLDVVPVGYVMGADVCPIRVEGSGWNTVHITCFPQSC